MLENTNRCRRYVRFLFSMRFICKVRMLQCLPHLIFLLIFGGLLPRLACAQGELRLSYLGTAGWEITDGKTVILVDPYLSRLKVPTPNDAVLSGDSRPLFTWDDIGVSDEAVIDAHIRKADFILITHTHGDHVLDLPYIARKTGATVIGTGSTINFARASGVPNSQLLAVKGGRGLGIRSFLRPGRPQLAQDSAARAQYATHSGPTPA